VYTCCVVNYESSGGAKGSGGKRRPLVLRVCICSALVLFANVKKTRFVGVLRVPQRVVQLLQVVEHLRRHHRSQVPATEILVLV
jgi:hypothetical protein